MVVKTLVRNDDGDNDVRRRFVLDLKKLWQRKADTWK